MNFKNIKKIFKKNYKKIIIVCLIMLILSNKMYENFTTTQALDAMKSTEKKVNDVYSKVDKDRVTIKKQLHMDNNLSLEAKQIRLKNAGDANHVIFYNKDIDGPEIKGWNGISLATGTGGAKRIVEIKKDQVKFDAKAKFNKGFEIHDPKKGASTKTVENGYWGGWRGMKTCPDNTYVCGLETRVEGTQGGGDDTAMNGIKMKCCKFNP